MRGLGWRVRGGMGQGTGQLYGLATLKAVLGIYTFLSEFVGDGVNRDQIYSPWKRIVFYRFNFVKAE